MTSYPTGTITFLFTDIEGSTKLWEQHPEAMRTALARHDALLRQAIETHGGYLFKIAGDAACTAFATAPAALQAALIGVAPFNRDSGTLRGKRAVWGGRPDVRTAIYMSTLAGIRWNPV